MLVACSARARAAQWRSWQPEPCAPCAARRFQIPSQSDFELICGQPRKEAFFYIDKACSSVYWHAKTDLNRQSMLGKVWTGYT